MAYSFMAGGLAYNINSDGRTVTVTYTSSQSPLTYSSKSTCERKGIVNYSNWGEGMVDINIPESVTYNGITYVVNAIGDGAFCYCDKITGKLTIPSTVTKIGNSAFQGCKGLTGDLIMSNIISVGEYAFYGCEGLDGVLKLGQSCSHIMKSAFNSCSNLHGELKLPEGMQIIEEKAFYACRGFSGNLFLPLTLTNLGKEAFRGCSGFTGSLRVQGELTRVPYGAFYGGHYNFITLGNNITIIEDVAFADFRNYKGELSIPSAVKSIGAEAFRNCTMSSLRFQMYADLKSIGDGAFFGCTNLTGSLTLADNLTSLGASAFKNCDNLTEIRAMSLATIGENAFAGCSKLAYFYSNAIESIGNKAFSGCKSLESFYLPVTTKSLGQIVFDGCNLSKGLKCDAPTPPTLEYTFYCYAFPLQVPSNVEAKYRAADGWKNFFRNFADENGVRYQICDNNIDVEVTFSNNAPEFNYMYLKNSRITIPSSVIFEGKGYNVVGIAAYAFQGAKGLVGIALPNSITKIGVSAFEKSGLTGALTIPTSVTTLDSNAFAYCTGITGTVTVPASVNNIPSGVFRGCTGITGYSLLNTQVTTLGSSMFSGCTGLKGKFTLPKHIKTIGNFAFEDCTGYTGELSIPANIEVYAYAFRGCSGFTSLYLPATLTTIGRETFSNCTGFKGTLHLPEGLKQIDESAFAGCTGFDEVDFPTTLTQLGKGAFSGCTGFTELYVPSNITSLGETVFCGCTGLKTVTLSTSASVPYQAFAECTGLRGVTNENATPNSMHAEAFSNYNVPLFVPEGKVDTYKNSSWKLFNNIYVIGTVVSTPGDINGDNKVDVADVNAVINIILGVESESPAADVNGDGSVDVADMNAIINIILGL
ncbi:MAG: leucine-rich repeat protein [Bacteroidales bacterium]|nr:leucine-rich repeat protein [Candidatus Sodaliphilus fimicaballi]